MRSFFYRYIFDKQDPDITTGILNSMELYIKIRSHAHEDILRIDTINATSNALVSEAFQSAWSILHRSGTMDTGLEITISAICKQMTEIPCTFKIEKLRNLVNIVSSIVIVL